MTVQEEKRALRREARARRAAHAADPRAGFLSAMRMRPEWRSARTAMLYLPFGVEPPTADLADDFRARGGAVCVPVWDPAAARYALAALPEDAVVAPGFGGVPEPVGTPRVDPAAVDLFVLPGLLFDRFGTRLGHGRGHLDRLLAERRPGAAVLGLAFPWQLRDAPLPREPHDIPMDAVVLPLKDRETFLRGREGV
jgi:5-formyltetrahydrofolate cyclo-ligase